MIYIRYIYNIYIRYITKSGVTRIKDWYVVICKYISININIYSNIYEQQQIMSKSCKSNMYIYIDMVDLLFVQFILVQTVFVQPVFVQRWFRPTLDSSNLLLSMTYIRPICFRPILVHFLFFPKNCYYDKNKYKVM